MSNKPQVSGASTSSVEEAIPHRAAACRDRNKPRLWRPRHAGDCHQHVFLGRFETFEEDKVSILQPWNIVFVIGFVIYVATRGRFASRTKDNESMERRVGLQEKILLPAMLVTGLLFPVIYLFSPLFSFADYELPDWIHGCGVAIMIAGLWLFWRSHADLGLNWSATLEMRKGHKIIKHGVYRRIRHPMYAAIWLFSIAQALLLNNWLAGWAVVCVFALMYRLRTPLEEQMMRDQFGKDYEDYMAETGRLFPPMMRWRAPH